MHTIGATNSTPQHIRQPTKKKRFVNLDSRLFCLTHFHIHIQIYIYMDNHIRLYICVVNVDFGINLRRAMHLFVIERINTYTVYPFECDQPSINYQTLRYFPFVRDMNYVCEKQMQLTLVESVSVRCVFMCVLTKTNRTCVCQSHEFEIICICGITISSNKVSRGHCVSVC